MRRINPITYFGCLMLTFGLIFGGIWPSHQLSHAQASSLAGKGLGTISTPTGTTIFVEIADSPDTRTQGLMFRSSMAPDRGMLFLFPEPGDHAFWMKNTLISLDMLWLDESGTILHLEANVPVCTRKDDGCPRYQAPHKSLQILELNAGMAKKLGLVVGNRLKIDLPPMSFPY
ncbi:MAG: DUF192 domain-containing protein [Nitrospirota bacterium]|nr:DUF192 domain-containing protein [Nitrospirota bacterium]